MTEPVRFSDSVSNTASMWWIPLCAFQLLKLLATGSGSFVVVVVVCNYYNYYMNSY